MAERSKAPDSREYSSLLWSEHSGPRMRAWVRIPLLTQTFCFSYKITEFSTAQASFRTLFMFSYFQCNVSLCNELSSFMNSLNDIWMNEFRTKTPSEMNGIQTKIKWFRNILKRICMYLQKKICRITKIKHLQSLLCYINRVYHCIDHPCVRKPYTAAYRLLCLSISTYLHIGGATSLTTTNTPYLIFRQTTTGRIERRALAFPFFLATVCSRQTIYDQHQCAAPW